jgi:hypothetical protein
MWSFRWREAEPDGRRIQRRILHDLQFMRRPIGGLLRHSTIRVTLGTCIGGHFGEAFCSRGRCRAFLFPQETRDDEEWPHSALQPVPILCPRENRALPVTF